MVELVLHLFKQSLNLVQVNPRVSILNSNAKISERNLDDAYDAKFLYNKHGMLHPADLFFRCPAGPRAWRRRRQAVRVTEYGGVAGCGAMYMISRSSSEPLRRLRQVNDYVDYVRLRRVSIGNVCAGT
jgi:hypothetical protein